MGDVQRALLGERCTYSGAGPGALQGGVGGTYSSGVLGLVDWVYPGYGTEGYTEKRVQGPTHACLVPNVAKMCLVS